MKPWVGVFFAVAAFGACASSTRAVLPPPSVPLVAKSGETVATESDAALDADDAAAPLAIDDGCPEGMVPIGRDYCIDRYEASLVELTDDGHEQPWPSHLVCDGHRVRARSAKGVLPQGYISAARAEDACEEAGKRLCTLTEWRRACKGPNETTYPYGAIRQPGTCNDSGKSAMAAVFGAELAKLYAPPSKAATKGSAKAAPGNLHSKHKASPRTKAVRVTRKKPTPNRKGLKKRPPTSSLLSPAEREIWSRLNDPRLGQVPGTLSLTGEHAECTNGYGVVDMVGNRHEWVSDETESGNGIFAGGYFLDTQINGEGCDYQTTAHATTYHDYSTGFRCCADLGTGDLRDGGRNDAN